MADEMNTEQIVLEVLGEVKEASQSIEDMETVSSLEGVSSLPGQKNGELVNVPLFLLEKPAKDAAAAANAAAGQAETVAGNASKAATEAAYEATKAASAASRADEAAQKANAAATLVEETTGVAFRGTTARFARMADDGRVEELVSTEPGGEIVYVRSAGLFAYAVGGRYFKSWSVAGVPPEGLYSGAQGVLKDKLYLCGDSVYTAFSGRLALLAHRHEILSEEEYEALAEKDENTLYMTYEEE